MSWFPKSKSSPSVVTCDSDSEVEVEVEVGVSTKRDRLSRPLSHVMVEPIFKFQFRFILIGDSTVGKSSLLRQFTEGSYAEVSDPTVGVDFFARLVKVKDGTNIKLQLWDTAGQERFRSITKSYYRNSVGVLLIYDICNRDSYTHIPVWMLEAKRHIGPHHVRFILVGCKQDIAKEDIRNREVSTAEAQSFADCHNIPFLETSAKTGLNVEKVFTTLTQHIFDRVSSGEYRLEEGWDGIKKGYMGVGNSSRPGSTNETRTGSRITLAEAEPASRLCC